jgi:hypothetical protein
VSGRSRLRGRTVRSWLGQSGFCCWTIRNTCRDLHNCFFVFYFCGLLSCLGDLWFPSPLWWGYYGCVSLNIFPPPFLCFMLLLGPIICAFENVVVPVRTIGAWSTLGQLFHFARVYFPSPVLADLPKIIDPPLFPCMMTYGVPIFMVSPFVVLLALVGIFSPCPPAGLVGLCLVTRLR